MEHLPGLPAGWVWARLADIADSIRNGTSVVPNAAHGTPVLRISAVRPVKLDVTDVRYLPGPPSDHAASLVAAGDILFTRYNGSKALVGVAALVPPLTGQLAHPDKLIRVRVRDALPAYVAMAANSGATRAYIASKVRTTAGQAGISGGDLRAAPIPIPPMVVQARIVAEIETQFSRLDAAVASLRSGQTKLKLARASVLKAAAEGRLVPTEAALARAEGRPFGPEAEVLHSGRSAAEGERPVRGRRSTGGGASEQGATAVAPAGWRWVTVSQVSSGPLANGRSVPTKDGGFPVLRLTAMKAGRLDLRESKQGAWTEAEATPWLVEEGDFFVMRGNGSLDRVGAAAIAPEITARVAFPDTMIRVRPDARLVLPRYLLCAWQAPAMRTQIERSARTTAGIHKVNQDSVAGYRIPLPPLAEQHRIVAEVDRRLSVLDALDATVERSLARCTALRQSILKLAFEGRLVSNHAAPTSTLHPAPTPLEART